MKNIFIFFIVLNLNLSFSKDAYSPYTVFNKQGKAISYAKMMKTVSQKSYIFFGEYHNNAISHWLQLEMTEYLYQLYKSKLVLGGEMFEADNQFILDEYLKGFISGKNFQNEMRLWPNYNTDYKPIIEFAKKNKLKYIATNVPRRYANMVYKKGIESLNDLSNLAKSYIVPLAKFKFDSTINCYKDMLNMPHGGIKMAQAQAIKDATMAHFILKNSNPQTKFLHFNGAYHSDNFEGIIHYLKETVELEKITNITTVSQDKIDQLESDYVGTADYIICVKSNFTNTH